MKKCSCILVLALLVGSNTFSQVRSLKGRVTDSLDNPVPYATILVKEVSKNDVALGAITNNNGFFLFDSIPFGTLRLIVSHISYQTYSASIPDSIKGAIPPVVLVKNSINLEEVTVSAKRTGVSQDLNKMVFVPNSRSIRESITSFDLIKKVPSVRISAKDFQIKVANNANVLVLINGTNSTRSLFSIAPQEIQRIEVIRNPTSEHGGEATAIVNVVLKQNQDNGLSLQLMGEYSVVRPVNNSSVQLVYDSGKLNIHGGYRLSHYTDKHIVSSIDRQDYRFNANSTYKLFSADGSRTSSAHEFSYGINYVLKENARVGFSGSYTPSLLERGSSSAINHFDGTGIRSSYRTGEIMIVDATKQKYSLYFKQNFLNPLKELHFIADLQAINRIRKTHHDVIGLANGEDADSPDRLEQTDNNWLTIASKLTYTNPLSEIWTLKVGAQYQHSGIVDEFNTSGGQSEVKYSENRSLLFSSVAYSKGKFTTLGSFGVEHKTAEILNGANSQSYFLPSIVMQYKIGDRQSVGLSYNKKLQYPYYYMLVPFVYYSADSLSATAGNLTLRPTQNNILKFSHNLTLEEVELYISSSVFFTYSKDVPDIVFSLNNGSLKEQWMNVTYSKSLGSSIESGVYLFNCVDITVEGELYHVFYPKRVHNGWIGSLYVLLDIDLPWALSLSADAYFSTKEYDINGYFFESPYIDGISISRKFLKNNAKFSLMLINPFFTVKEKEVHWDNSFKEVSSLSNKSMALSFRFTYFFNQKRNSKLNYKPMLIDDQPVNK